MPVLPLESITSVGHLVVGTNSPGLSTARRHIYSIAKQHFSEDEALDILIAVGEAISNAYRHGTRDRSQGLISVDWCFSGKTLTVSAKDEGLGFPEDLTGTVMHRGHGLDIMRKTVDHVRVEYDNGTRLVLTKRVSW